MADRAVLFVLAKLSDPLIQEAALLYGVRDQVEWLRAELQWTVCFLKDADAKRRKGNELAKNWVREVREVAHRAEDIIDTFMLEIEPRLRSRGLMGRIKRYAAFPCESRARHKVGVGIKGLRAKIDQIKASWERYGLVDLGDAAGSEAISSVDDALQARRRISPHLDDDNTVIVGLDIHKEKLLEQLLDANTTRRCVVSIVGTGGIGKTTLAKKLYNCSKIRTRFRTRACVSVSQDCRVDELLKSIAKQIMGTTTTTDAFERVDIDDLKEKLHKFLKARRYFMVLDDVWRTSVWEQLRAVLPDAKNGSRVLVTTRSSDVARSADPSIPSYQLPFLNDEESWELFIRRAFLANQDAEALLRCPQELEDIGRRLVKRCGCLPLALQVLGGLLSRKESNPIAWMRVAERMDWASTQDGEDCLKILGLSYDDLPHHLRSCFLYLSAFPEDWEIDTTRLIQLWIAEGFIPRTQTMEDTAQDYLEELAQRSMVQIANKLPDGSFVICRIHDLFRDMCIREAREDGFLDAYNRVERDHTLHRLALHNLTTDNYVQNWCPSSNLKSLLAFETRLTSEMFNGLKLLRVIDLEECHKFSLVRFPKEITSMIHLRYLRMSGSEHIRELPSSIGNLYQLQTLDVARTQIRRIPEVLGKIQTLRHLYSPCSECPSNIGNLTNLQTLIHASARGGWIEQRGLEKLVNMRDLSVSGLKATQGEAFLDSIRKLKRLSSLKLNSAELILIEFITGLSNHDHLHRLELVGPISQGRLPTCPHEFPPNLTALKLHGSKLEQDPMAMLEKLPNLVYLDIYGEAFVGKEIVCTAGGFPRLQELILSHFSGLENWRVEAGAMPKLTSLTIYYCSSLTMIPHGLQHVTSLKNLTVYDPREEFKDRLRSDVGEDWYKIRHVPSITTGYD